MLIALTANYVTGSLDTVDYTHVGVQYSHDPLHGERINAEAIYGTYPGSVWTPGKVPALRYTISGADYDDLEAEASGAGNDMARWLQGLCKWLSDNKTELAGTVVAFCLFFLPSVAGAQTAPEETVGTATEIGLGLYEMLGGALLGLISWLGVHLQKWMSARTKNETINGILGRAAALATQVVKEIHQAELKALKEAKDPNSPGGAKVTKEELEGLRDLAVNRLKSHMGTKGIKEAMAVMGMGGSAFDGLLGTMVESAVHDTKRAAASLADPA